MEYEDREDREERFAKVWWKSRSEAKVSQEKMAMELGVAKKTIQNWEKGVSAPDLFQGIEWFRTLGLNPIPYLMSFVFPEKMDEIAATDPDERIEEAIEELIKYCSIETKRKLLFLFWGVHGGSPTAAVDLITAFLQLPLKERVEIATQIATAYDLNKELNSINSPEHIQPDMEKLMNAISEAKKNVLSGQDGYTIINKQDNESLQPR